MPELANVHIDVALTNLSIAYTNNAYVANEVFPVVPVPLRSDKYFLYNKDSFLRSSGVDAQGRAMSTRRPGTRSQQILFDVSTNPYYAEQLARNYPLTDAEVKLADVPLQPENDATIALTEMIKIDNEVQVANKAMKRANYNTGNKVQLVTSTTSWAAATGKPLSVDIQNGKKSVILGVVRAATNMALNYSAAVTLSQNAEYVTRIQYVSKEALTRAGLLPVVSGLTVVEANSQKITSNENLTPITSGYCWVDDQGQDGALIYYKPAGKAGLKTVALGLTFDAPDDTFGTHGYVVKRWREEWLDAQIIEVRNTLDWRFVATDGSGSGDNANGFATGGYLVSGVTL